jgi:DNA topoisomerase VI subunit A
MNNQNNFSNFNNSNDYNYDYEDEERIYQYYLEPSSQEDFIEFTHSNNNFYPCQNFSKFSYPMNSQLNTNTNTFYNYPSYSVDYSQSQPSQKSQREEKELEIKNNLILKCEEFFTHIFHNLNSSEKLEILVIDLDKNSRFNYDEGHYTLPISDVMENFLISGESIKYLTYNLHEDSERIAKLFKVISIIYTKSLKNTSMTKRELYYNDVDLFKNTQNIDTILQDICSIFQISRWDLSVFPAQKGLFAGDLLVYDSEGILLNSSQTFDKINLISFDYFLEDLKFESNAKFILVVEKESLFFNFISNKIYQDHFLNSIIITGKGFPDYITKYFLKKVSQNLNIPIFYFGDFDPSGFEIYLNYIFGCKTSSRENHLMTINRMNWIGLKYEIIYKLIEIEGEDSLQLIKLDDKELKKIETILSKEFFNLEAWDSSISHYRDSIVDNLQNLAFQFEQMAMCKFKAEGEVIISKFMEYFVQYLNNILNELE